MANLLPKENKHYHFKGVVFIMDSCMPYSSYVINYVKLYLFNKSTLAEDPAYG